MYFPEAVGGIEKRGGAGTNEDTRDHDCADLSAWGIIFPSANRLGGEIGVVFYIQIGNCWRGVFSTFSKIKGLGEAKARASPPADITSVP
jgi:hypothetical protein